MEIEQLVGIVRHMRAQKEALDYMDEVLTVVQENRDLVQNYQKEAKAELEKVAQAKADLDALRKKQDEELASFSSKCQALMDDAKAEAEARVADSNLKVQEAEKKIKDLGDVINSRVSHIESLNHDTAIFESKLKGVMSEYDDLKSTIAKIKASL